MMFFLNQVLPNRFEDFIRTLFSGLGNGGLLFGMFDSWTSALSTLFDVSVTAAVIYYVLKLFDDSRAWQLLKGFIFLLALTFLSGFLGLTTINYILSNSMSVLVIGFVVIFQPELRKALEAVGRNSLNLLSSVSSELSEESGEQINMIEALTLACENMAAEKTGALIVIERKTGLAELIDNSPTAVILNANLTSTALEQIFYKNSPLHDGALIIRNGRIYAARCHVPLSDTYHLRKDMGTRHRAAIGASEFGDAVAIVVSEEKGSISITMEGKIYQLENADALRSVLHRVFSERFGTKAKDGKLRQRSLRSFFRSVRRSAVGSELVEESNRLKTAASEGEDHLLASEEKRLRRNKRQRLGKQALSVFLAFVLYLYVQMVVNPIETENFRQLPIAKEAVIRLNREGYKVVTSEQTANIVLRARRNTLNRIRNNQSSIVVSLTIPEDKVEPGSYNWKTTVRVTGLNARSYQVSSLDPIEVSVLVTLDRPGGEEILPGLHRPGSGGISTETQP